MVAVGLIARPLDEYPTCYDVTHEHSTTPYKTLKQMYDKHHDEENNKSGQIECYAIEQADQSTALFIIMHIYRGEKMHPIWHLIERLDAVVDSRGLNWRDETNTVTLRVTVTVREANATSQLTNAIR